MYFLFLGQRSLIHFLDIKRYRFWYIVRNTAFKQLSVSILINDAYFMDVVPFLPVLHCVHQRGLEIMYAQQVCLRCKTSCFSMACEDPLPPTLSCAPHSWRHPVGITEHSHWLPRKSGSIDSQWSEISGSFLGSCLLCHCDLFWSANTSGFHCEVVLWWAVL